MIIYDKEEKLRSCLDVEDKLEELKRILFSGFKYGANIFSLKIIIDLPEELNNLNPLYFDKEN